jgi:phospholipid/cholesterol/gamma-HCH transport system permease protein
VTQALVTHMSWRGAFTLWHVPPRALLERLHQVVAGSLVLVVAGAACVGAAMADQAARQALRLLGDQSFIGPEYLTLGVETFGPLVTALALAQRVGAGFAAEVATEQSEDTLAALALYGREPLRTRIAPMGTALVIGTLALVLLALVVWELAGMAALSLRSSVNPFTFFHPEAIKLSGVVLLVSKSLVCGALVYACAVRAGLRAREGAEEVGRAATSAVVTAVVACLAASALLDLAWFLLRGARVIA